MKLLPAIVAALLATAPVVPAIESAADQARARAEIRPELSLGDFERFSAESVPDDQWPAVIEALGQEDRARVARALIRGLQPFPAKQLLPLLQHSRLAVRLGALDLLEEAAGDDFGFDPWSEAPATGANAGALVKWQAWVESGTPAAQPAATLTDEAFRAAATEVMSGERARVERGMQRLEAFGLNAVARIESFLQTQSGLEPAPRAQLKAAQYRLILLTALPRQAAGLARDLALGTLEQQSAALAALGEGGASVLPILGDFLAVPDPLLRETAVDSAFKAAGAHAVPLILARLGSKLSADDPATEHTESVLHSMIRGLGKTGADTAVIARYLQHPSENVVITALEALAENTKGDLTAPLSALLADPRWRVRATALETIGKRGSGTLHDLIMARLDDADSFVRVSAVGALIGGSSSHSFSDDDEEEAGPAKTSQPDLTPYFLRYDDLKPPILKYYIAASSTPPSAAMIDALWKAPPETLLQAIDLFDNRDESFGGDEKRARWKPGFVARFATHPNADVAAAALRILAGHGRYTGQLLATLQGTDAVRTDAVLDVLVLPPASAAPAEATPARNPTLDQLYDALAKAPAKATPATDFPTETEASPAELRKTLLNFLQSGSPRQQFAAACVLLAQRDEDAARFLLTQYDTLSALDCRRVANSLGPAAPWEGPFLELARLGLRHPAGDVRETAISVWLESAKAAGLGHLLDEYSRPGSLLAPDDLYDYEFENILRTPASYAPVLEWSAKILKSPAPPAQKVFAMVLLGRTNQVRGQRLEGYLDDANPHLRRAAFRALGRPAVEAHLPALLNDKEAIVRSIIPFTAAPARGWVHRFDDAHSTDDRQDYDRRPSFGGNQSFGAWAQNDPAATNGPSVDLIPAVEKLAQDPADLVRFEAQFALLRLGRPIDPSAFAAVLATQKENSSTRYLVKNWFSSNFQRLGKGYAVLVPVLQIDGSDSSEKRILTHFGLDGAQSPYSSFQGIAALAPAKPKPADNAIAPPEPEAKSTGQPFRVLFFYKPGCRDCDRVRDQLNRLASSFPQMTLEERNIEAPGEALLNETLSTRLGIRDVLHQVAPAVFTQGGALVRDGLTYSALDSLLRATSALTPDPAWADAAKPELAAATERITERYAGLDLGVVATAGLLDGINPCAFATIIFLLSYLQVARRTPGEILAVGVAFISAVFLAYFLVGLGLVQLLERAAAFRVAGQALNYALAGLAAVVAVLSFRDARLAADGHLGEMTLQLPGFLKDQIRTTVRASTRARRFVIGAFLAGLAISLLELACTGQVYLPTIQFMLRSGQREAVGLLLLYNSAFIVPLVVIFILAWAGMRSETLIAFQRKHTALAKVLTGALFLALAVFLVFGHAWLAK
jgi:cytochrome c biogenesis protein CcdA/HEAT repeat protein